MVFGTFSAVRTKNRELDLSARTIAGSIKFAGIVCPGAKRSVGRQAAKGIGQLDRLRLRRGPHKFEREVDK